MSSHDKNEGIDSPPPGIEERLKALELIEFMNITMLNKIMSVLNQNKKGPSPLLDLLEKLAKESEEQKQPGLAAAIRNIINMKGGD